MVFDKVLAFCEKEKISISAFEKMCEIGNGTVGRWRNNDSEPTIATLRKMEEKTGIKIADWVS